MVTNSGPPRQAQVAKGPARHTPYKIESTHIHKGQLLLKLEGVDSADAAGALRGYWVLVPLERRELRGQSRQEQEQEIAEYLREDRRRGFKLEAAAKMRVCVMRRGEQRWEVIWSHHHMALDGWSSAVVMKEAMSGSGKRRRPYRD